MRDIGIGTLHTRNVIVLPEVNHRVTSFAATKNDEMLSYSMASSETEVGSGVYGWGENYRVRALCIHDPFIYRSGLIPGVTNVEQLKVHYMDRMRARHAGLKQDVETTKGSEKDTAIGILDAFQQLYCEKEELAEPDWEVAVLLIEGHHRRLGKTLERALVQCELEGKTFSPNIPFAICRYTSLKDLRVDQAKGNGVNQVHNPLSDLDLIALAIISIPSGMSETEFRKLTGKDTGSTGRRAYVVAKLHIACPELDVMGHLSRYLEKLQTYTNEGLSTKEAVAKLYNTAKDVVPLEALHNNANDYWGNVPAVLRLIGEKSDLEKHVNKPGNNPSPWELEAVAKQEMWDMARRGAWFRSRIPALNGGKLETAVQKTSKADTTYVKDVMKAGLISSIGAKFGRLAMMDSASARENDPTLSYIMLNSTALTATDSLLSSDSADDFRQFVIELETAYSAVPEAVKSLLGDFRAALQQTAAKAAEEAAAPVSVPTAVPADVPETKDVPSAEPVDTTGTVEGKTEGKGKGAKGAKGAKAN